MTNTNYQSSKNTIKRALLSVSDKRNIDAFAIALHELGIEILSTGGTAKRLLEHGIPVTLVSEYTRFPEIMDGRVKTLHPKIHAGLLARADTDDEVLQKYAIPYIDLAIVNLYPFSEVTDNPSCTLDIAVENIDIGGPCMIRAAAKNFERVGIVIDPDDYQAILSEIQQSHTLSDDTRFALAQKAFAHTANYDSAIAAYLSTQHGAQKPVLTDNLSPKLRKVSELRYGENPHQHAALYRDNSPASGTVITAKQHQGKTLSFNNIIDSDAALACVQQFEQPACVIVKHTTPCGAACADDLITAYQLAYRTDPNSSFGGIIAFNQPLDEDTIQTILKNQFVEVIIAPAFTPAALATSQHKPNLRLLAYRDKPSFSSSSNHALDYKRIAGGFLVQEMDNLPLDQSNWQVVTSRQPSSTERQDLIFAWLIAKQAKSNAIVYAKQMTTLGIGSGQTSRIDSARYGALRAQEYKLDLKSAVMASDAFLPFSDVCRLAAEQGIGAIIQPGGSIRDKEVINAADAANIAMIFTYTRHFKH